MSVTDARRADRDQSAVYGGPVIEIAKIVATIDTTVQTLDEARSRLSRFQTIIRERRRPDLDVWIEAATRSLFATFARGLLKDKAAVAAALTPS